MGTRIDKEIVWMNNEGTMNINTICSYAWVPDNFNSEHDNDLNTDLHCPAGYRAATDEEFAEWLAKKLNIEEYHIVERSTMGMDNYWRKAWEHDEKGSVIIDHGKAVEIQKNNLRFLRAPILDSLDKEQMTAISRGDKNLTEEIEKRKQNLRDLPDHPDIKTAVSLEDLKMAGIELIINKGETQ